MSETLLTPHVIETSSEIWKLQDDACRRHESSYTDPDSGYHVFTAFGLQQRENCCGSGCRHCPFAHENVPTDRRALKAQQPSWLTDTPPPSDGPVDLLFWSGGKDSFLTLRALQRTQPGNRVVLVTTFCANERRVAHQELELDSIIRQADHLELPLLGIPLHSGREYRDAVEPAIRLVKNAARLVFGDLHLRHIREWREEAFAVICGELNLDLSFPLWQADYETLMRDLEASGVVCEVSAVTEAAEGQVKRGDKFDRKLYENLSETIDAFGENGEFHTLVKVWDTDPTGLSHRSDPVGSFE